MHTAADRQEFVEYITSFIPQNSICVEVGVERGDFSEKILKNIKPFQLFLVDPWAVDDRYKDEFGLATAYGTNDDLKIIKEKFSNEIIKNQVILKKGFSYDVVNEFPDDFFDFIYIDACHLYECVRDDLKMFLPKLKKNGLMCGHDYMDFKEAEKSGHTGGNLTEMGREFGVVEAVDEFVIDNDFEWIATSIPNFYLGQIPDFALKKL